jgi:hypothetical protein
MKISFGKLVMASAALAAVTMAAAPAMAETTTLKVPFNFTVNGRALPAGTYSIERDTLANTLRLAGTYASQGFIWSAAPNADKNKGRVVLQFDENSHALRSVQYGAVVTSRLDKGTGKTEDISPRVIHGQ